MSNKEDKIAKKINKIISGMMNRVMERVLSEAPLIEEKHRSNKPLDAALLPDEIFKDSHFERPFVLPFGKVW